MAGSKARCEPSLVNSCEGDDDGDACHGECDVTVQPAMKKTMATMRSYKYVTDVFSTPSTCWIVTKCNRRCQLASESGSSNACDVNRRHHRYSVFWSYNQIRQHKVLGNTGPSKSHQFTSRPLSCSVAGSAEGPARCESSLMEAAAAPSGHSKYIATKPRAHRSKPYRDS